MAFLKLLLMSVILMAVVFLAMGIKMLFDKKATFTGGSCNTSIKGREGGEFSCACGRDEPCRNDV